MSTAIINSAAYSSIVLSGILTSPAWVKVGSTDYGAILTAAGDGKTASLSGLGLNGSYSIGFLDDGVTLPAGAVIQSVQFSITAKGQNYTTNFATPQFWNDDIGPQNVPFSPVPSVNETQAAFVTYSTAALATNPQTSLAWQRLNLFSAASPNLNSWYVTMEQLGGGGDNVTIDRAFLTVLYSIALPIASTSLLPVSGSVDGGS